MVDPRLCEVWTLERASISLNSNTNKASYTSLSDKKLIQLKIVWLLPVPRCVTVHRGLHACLREKIPSLALFKSPPLTSRFFKKFKLICLLIATMLFTEENGGKLQTKQTIFKQTVFKYQRMLLGQDAAEGWEILQVKRHAEQLAQNRPLKDVYFMN